MEDPVPEEGPAPENGPIPLEDPLPPEDPLLDKEEIREAYDSFARWYDLVEGLPDLLGVGRLRGRLLGRAGGKVLEVAVGTGRNFPHYPGGCRITGVDLSPAMLEEAGERARRLEMEVDLKVMDAEALDFPDDSFDTVVETLTLCTFTDPIRALDEMGRVCRPGGKILLLEHGRSSRNLVGRLQDRTARWHASKIGCHWNREPRRLVEASGLTLRSARRTFLGIFHLMEAAPAPEAARAQDEREPERRDRR